MKAYDALNVRLLDGRSQPGDGCAQWDMATAAPGGAPAAPPDCHVVEARARQKDPALDARQRPSRSFDSTRRRSCGSPGVTRSWPCAGRRARGQFQAHEAESYQAWTVAAGERFAGVRPLLETLDLSAHRRNTRVTTTSPTPDRLLGLRDEGRLGGYSPSCAAAGAGAGDHVVRWPTARASSSTLRRRAT